MKLVSMWPFRHAGLKVVSVALAVALWMAVSGEEVVERGLRVPLELQQFPPGLELSGEPPTLVDVRVRGGSGTLSRLSPGEIVAVLDLNSARPGRRLFQLTPENVRAPFGVQVVQVTQSIAMVFENSATRQVPIVAEIEGDPAPGFIVGKVMAEPKTVEVTGPESAVARAIEAVTEPVSVAGARDHITETVRVGLLDPLLRLKTPRSANVRVEVLPGPRERSLGGQPIHLRNLDPALAAQALPPAVEVVLRGSREGLNRVELGDVLVYVDLAGLGVGDYSLPVEVDVSKDAGVARILPAAVEVRITRARD